MSVEGFLTLLLIAAVCGFIAEAVVGYSLGGLLASTVVGLVGAYIGNALAQHFGWPVVAILPLGGTTQNIDLAWTVVGAIVCLSVVGFLRGKRA